MAKKPSFDTAKIKEFLFQKGERLGLGVAGGITLLLLVLGFVGITTRPPADAGSPTWSGAFTDAGARIEQQMRVSTPPQVPKDSTGTGKFPDAIARPESYLLNPTNPHKDDKRRNPPILTVNSQTSAESREIQVDYLLAPCLAYDVDFVSKKIRVAGTQPVKYLDPQRLAVVTATFPYQEQLKLYMDALQYTKKEELLRDKAMPHFLGLNVWRSEVVPGSKEEFPNLVHLYVYNQDTKKLVVHPPLDKFLRRMVIDSNNPAELAASLAPNMVTPLPYLASDTPDVPAKYPKLHLTGFEQTEGTDEDGGKGKTPTPAMQPGFGNKGTGDKGAGTGMGAYVFWKQLQDQELVARLNGKYNAFNPFGRLEGKEGKEVARPTVPNLVSPQNPQKQKETEKEEPATVPVGIPADDKAAELPRLLARFIDIDLEVGKTYHYHIQVRMANPNYGNTKDVISQELASTPALASAQGTTTPSFKVPGEIHYYACDQAWLNAMMKLPLKSGKVRGGADSVITHASDVNAPVQIHRWIKDFKTQETTHFVGDWAIAERALVRRGDPLGHTLLVEVPEWNVRQGKFTMAMSTPGPKQKPIPFVAVNFMPDETPAPLLVDFQGGTHDKYRPQKTATSLGTVDHAATELLILDESGKLLLRNSNDDSTDAERRKRYEHWGHRLDVLREGSAGKTPGGPPGVRGGPGVAK
jgi:hypothetical protein